MCHVGDFSKFVTKTMHLDISLLKLSLKTPETYSLLVLSSARQYFDWHLLIAINDFHLGIDFTLRLLKFSKRASKMRVSYASRFSSEKSTVSTSPLRGLKLASKLRVSMTTHLKLLQQFACLFGKFYSNNLDVKSTLEFTTASYHINEFTISTSSWQRRGEVGRNVGSTPDAVARRCVLRKDT